jgi:Kef-type K+ transport system membrane component KefB
MTTRTRTWVRSALEVGYVASVAILAIVATSDPNHMAYPAFDAALALCMPSLLLLLPAFYALVGNVWNVTGADHGGITWPVTAAYVVMFTAAAILNVGLVSMLVGARTRRRA